MKGRHEPVAGCRVWDTEECLEECNSVAGILPQTMADFETVQLLLERWGCRSSSAGGKCCNKSTAAATLSNGIASGEQVQAAHHPAYVHTKDIVM